MKALSIKDIAKQANVSITTVSFIMNGKAEKMRISQDMITKVEKIIKDVGFRPNQVARSLRTGCTKTIALIVEDISNPFFAAIARLIEDKAHKYGYKIIYSSTEHKLEKARGLIRMFKSRQVDGYIIAPMPGMEEDLKALLEDRVPLVLFDRSLPGLEASCVLVNNIQATYNATTYLVQKGKRNIAFITVDMETDQIGDRYKGYVKALKASDIDINEQWCKIIPFTSTPEETTAELVSFFKANPEVDAVLFATNYLAVRGLFSFREIRKQIGKDFMVVAYDDQDLFRLFTPAITVVHQPVEDIAEQAISLLLKSMSAVDSHEEQDVSQVMLSATLIER